jgi:hypothetical protein
VVRCGVLFGALCKEWLTRRRKGAKKKRRRQTDGEDARRDSELVQKARAGKEAVARGL